MARHILMISVNPDSIAMLRGTRDRTVLWLDEAPESERAEIAGRIAGMDELLVRAEDLQRNPVGYWTPDAPLR
jgi:hypothetical protein